MELSKTNEFDNKLLSRKECTYSVGFKGAAPTKKDVKTEIIKDLGAKEDLTVVREVQTRFGSNSAHVSAFVYDNAENMKRIENLTMHKKIEEKIKAEEEAAAEAKKAEEEAKKAEEEAKKAEEAKPTEEAAEESEDSEKPEEKSE